MRLESRALLGLWERRNATSGSFAPAVFITLAALLLPAMVLASFDFGVTWDEMDRHNNGVRIWEFLRGLRSRSSFRETGGHVYPGLFDTICAALETWVPANRYVLRHAVNATFGWVGVVYCGRLAARLFGRWPGVLAMALLALSPRYFADSMNNPKDLPFAAMTVVALYYISTVSARWPYVSPSTAIKIVVSLALALNTRVGALLYLGYFGLLVAVLAVVERRTDWRRLVGTAGRVAGVAVSVLVLGTVFWPWAGGAPLTRPFEALLGAANYPWDGEVLFNGYEYKAVDLPWYYAPWWLLISTPPVVLAGAALSPFFVSSRLDALRRIGLWAVVLLPLAAGIIMRSTLYDGIRHLLFIYPVFVAVAVSGWTGVLRASVPPWGRRTAAAGLAMGLLSLTVFDVRFHPNQGVYFNGLVGGPAGAFKRYDMDYWGNCILQGVEWTAGMARSYGRTVVIGGRPGHLVWFNAARFQSLYFTDGDDYHVGVQLARGPRAYLRKVATQPALHQVRTPDGAVLCTVTAGPAFADLDPLRRREDATGRANHQ
ncbi:MAG TPA: hypothetical protein VLD67_18285 [Vicinamibacterales bacterium]|nr:hypothetical protein [Vicinamibacterales bacterium]